MDMVLAEATLTLTVTTIFKMEVTVKEKKMSELTTYCTDHIYTLYTAAFRFYR